jgi:hypothetical protein
MGVEHRLQHGRDFIAETARQQCFILDAKKRLKIKLAYWGKIVFNAGSSEQAWNKIKGT